MEKNNFKYATARNLACAFIVSASLISYSCSSMKSDRDSCEGFVNELNYHMNREGRNPKDRFGDVYMGCSDSR